VTTNTYCVACAKWLDTAAAIEAHNIECASSGERSYVRAVNVAVRTTVAKRVVQGSGVWAKGR
jgi:hypothetical protein